MSIYFTAYDKKTGKVLYGGTASSPESLKSNDNGVLIGAAYQSGWIEDGKHFGVPEAPSINHTFDWNSKQWVDARTHDTEWARVRQIRSNLLANTDWTDTLSAKTRLGDALYAAWQAYRQALRDVTGQPDPFNIAWPTPPSN